MMSQSFPLASHSSTQRTLHDREIVSEDVRCEPGWPAATTRSCESGQRAAPLDGRNGANEVSCWIACESTCAGDVDEKLTTTRRTTRRPPLSCPLWIRSNGRSNSRPPPDTHRKKGQAQVLVLDAGPVAADVSLTVVIDRDHGKCLTGAAVEAARQARGRPGPAGPRVDADDRALRADHRPDRPPTLGASHQGQHQRRAHHPGPGRAARSGAVGQDPLRHRDPDPAARLLRPASAEELPTPA